MRDKVSLKKITPQTLHQVQQAPNYRCSRGGETALLDNLFVICAAEAVFTKTLQAKAPQVRVLNLMFKCPGKQIN